MLDEKTKHVPLNLVDDNIALEDPEAAMLTLRVSPGSPCSNVKLSPLASTTILIHDNDSKFADPETWNDSICIQCYYWYGKHPHWVTYISIKIDNVTCS